MFTLHSLPFGLSFSDALDLSLRVRFLTHFKSSVSQSVEPGSSLLLPLKPGRGMEREMERGRAEAGCSARTEHTVPWKWAG